MGALINLKLCERGIGVTVFSLLLVYILKEMVGMLVSDIKANAGVQKLLPAIQKFSGTSHHGLHDLFQALMVSKQPPDHVSNMFSRHFTS